jgi:hypothetical protein
MVVAATIILLAALDRWPQPFTKSDIRLNNDDRAALERIRDEPGVFCVLTAPSHESYWHVFFQTIHHQPILGGGQARYRQSDLDDLSKRPLLPFLYGYRDLSPYDLPLERARTQLNEKKVRFVICLEAKYDELAQRLGLEIEYTSDRFRVYRVPG